jgi:dTMP kinase
VYGVAEKLKEVGFDVLVTKEPTASPLGDFVRKSESVYGGRVLAHLVAADRRMHIERYITPALSNGKLVITDRYIESSLALQTLDGIDIEKVWALNEPITIPNFSFILTANPPIIEKRMTRRIRRSRFEKKSTPFREVEAYKKASAFLIKKGFKVVNLQTDSQPSSRNIRTIVEMIVQADEDAKKLR